MITTSCSHRETRTRARGVEEARRLQLRLGPLAVGLGVGDDAAADTEVRTAVGDGERTDRDRELRALALAVDPSDRAAVDPAPYGLEILDRLHDPRLRRARDRRGWERGPHDVGE